MNESLDSPPPPPPPGGGGGGFNRIYNTLSAFMLDFHIFIGSILILINIVNVYGGASGQL